MKDKNLYDTIFSGISASQVAAIDQICEQLKLAVGVVNRLRGPYGCPWDREQNHLTIRQYLIEEAFEVLEVLDRFHSTRDPKEIAKQTSKEAFVAPDGYFSKEDQKNLTEELGDLLLQILLHSQIAWERGDFNAGDVGSSMARKLVSRHPHVFGSGKVSSSEQVLQNWETLKKNERAGVEEKKGVLSGLPKNLPSLQRAARIGEKVKGVGFDWKDYKGALAKVEEELSEVKEAISGENREAIEDELGDLFFALCNLSRHLKVQPEDAHRKAIGRFEQRFNRVEQICEKEGIDMHKASLEELDEIWDRVKLELRSKK